MPRYVILLHEMPRHAAPQTHYDVMLEWGEVLRTWAIDEPPRNGVELPAFALADHRLAYLEYEGDVSGDRGRVSRWDAGVYDLLKTSPTLCEVELRGAKLHGRCRLTARDANQWRVLFSESLPVEKL